MSKAGAAIAAAGVALIAFTLVPGGSNTMIVPQDAAAAPANPGGGSTVSMDNLSPAWSQVPQDMRPHFFTAQEKSGCSLATPWLLAAIAEKESGFNRMAVSPVGAKGVMQIMDNTKAGAGVTDAFDPAQAIPGAGRVLCQKEEATRSRSNAPLLVRTLAAYNGGEGNVGRTIPTSMQRYAESVIAAAKKYEVLPAADAPKVAGGAVKAGDGYQKMEAELRKAFPNVVITSRFRPGSRTTSGNASYHSIGRALDIEPKQEIYEWLMVNYPNSTELIFAPEADRNIYKGKTHRYKPKVLAMHYDHIHWAM